MRDAANVSVVIPSYRHARFLRQRVESVLRQTYQDFELILLDDCSPDGSQAILMEYASDPRVRIEFNQENSGSTFKQWNKGVRLARGKYVWIAESDDYANERLLEKTVARLESDASIVLCNSRSWCVTGEGAVGGFIDSVLKYLHPTRWTEDFEADGREECRKYLVQTNTILSASSVVFRREAYWNAGGADENLRYCGDWKVWAGMALGGGKIAHVGEPLNYYRMHEATMTAQSDRFGMGAAETLAVAVWIMERVEIDPSVRAALFEAFLPRWSAAALSSSTPLRRRLSIFRDAAKINERAWRKLIVAGLVALRLTARRRYRSLWSRVRPARGDRAVGA